MRRLVRILLVLCVAIVSEWAGGIPGDLLDALWAQAPYPPSAWHPYQGGVNCIQVADANGFFNCAPNVTVNPVTGAFSLGGGAGFQAPNGVALVPSGVTYQLLGTGDLVIAASPPTIAPAGPRINGVVLRVRQKAPGLYQLVVAGGNGLQEFVIPVLSPLGQPTDSFAGGGPW